VGKAYLCMMPLRIAYATSVHRCLGGDTLLSVAGRGLVPIEALAVDTPNVWAAATVSTCLAGAQHSRNVIAVFNGGDEETLELETEKGYSVVCGRTHKFLVCRDDGELAWCPAKDIRSGDLLAIKAGARVGAAAPVDAARLRLPPLLQCETPPVDAEVAYLLGALFGDGYLSEQHEVITFGKRDRDVVDTVRRIMVDRFGVKPMEPAPRRTAGCTVWVTVVHGKQATEMLTYLEAAGLPAALAHAKRVPWTVTQGPLDVQAAFLRGCFDTDGGITAAQHTVDFTTTSLQAAKVMQAMLANLGVVCDRRECARAEAHHHDYAHLRMSGPSARVFMDAVGFASERKRVEAEATLVASSPAQASRSKAVAWPHGQRLLRAFVDEGGMRGIAATKAVQQRVYYIANGYTQLRPEILDYLCDSIPDMARTKAGSALLQLRAIGFRLDAVAGIRSAGMRRVYDVQVNDHDGDNVGIPDNNDYIAAGAIVTHNCQGLTLSRVRCNLSRVFEMGYVDRCTQAGYLLRMRCQCT
jgi:hypothetical protein